MFEALPAASVTVTVSESYVPSANSANTTAVLPSTALAGDGELIVCDAVIAPASSLVIVNVGVLSVVGVLTAAASLIIGAV